MASDNGYKGRVIQGVPRLAEHYGLSRPTIYRYMSLPIPLPGIKIDGQWLFHLDNTDEWFKKLTNVPPKLSDKNIGENSLEK